MLELSDRTETALPAATVVLLRDGPAGPETLLVQRSKAVKHMGGLWVFPGGKVDATDRPPDGDSYQAAVNAAVRETREEAGLEIDPGQLVYLSHWTTPEGARKRYATWFFLAILEAGQEVRVDGGEIVHHRWVQPSIALEELGDAERAFRVLPPTYVSLAHIAPYASCTELRRTIGAQKPIVFEPRMAFVEDGICFLYAEDAGYERAEADVEGPRHRIYMIDERLEYIRE